MAPKKKTATKATKTNKTTSKKAKSALPEGFEEISGSRVDGWFVLREENSITGRLLEVFYTKSKFNNPDSPTPGRKKAYKLEITSGRTIVVAADKKNEETLGQEIEVGPGSVVGLDEKGFIKRLSEVTPGTVVYVECQGKLPKSKEYPQGAWQFLIGKASDPEGMDPETGELDGDDSDDGETE